MPSNGNDITLKMNVDIKDADSAIKSFNNTTQKAFKSSNTYVNSLGNSLNKVTQNIQNTKAKMDTLANTRVPTDKFKTLQTTIASLEKQASSAKKELDAIGKTRLYTTQYQGVTDTVNDLSKKLQVARTELGKLQTFGTNKGATLAKQLEVNSLTKQLKYAIDKQIQLEQAGQKFQANSAYDAQAQKVNTLTKALQQANYQAQQMQSNNTAYMSGANTEEYAQLSRQLSNAVNQGTILQKTINNIHSGGHKLAQIFKNFGTSAKNAISRVANAIKNKLNGAINHTSTNHNKSFKKMLTTVLKYGFGIRSIFLLYRKIRAVMKEGLTSMAQQFSETRVQVDSLKNSWSGFKASLVSAFQPIFSYVVPALTTLINYLTSAMNTLANFFAILTGQGWYYKAKKGNESVAKSIGGTGSAAKEANEQLAEYDDLLVIDQNNSGSGGSGGGGGGSSDAWNWEKTDASPSKFAELLKEAFKTWDFTEVGEYIGQKLTDALNSINWDKIYQTAKNFGKGLATFLNGLISPELFGALGTTIANAITTALLFLNTFGTTFDWKDFGHSIAEGIKKFVEHSPLKLAVNTFNVWAKGILDTLITAVRDLLDSGTMQKISDHIAEAIGELDLGGITWKAGSLVSGLLNSLYVIVSNKNTWKNLGTKIGDGINGIFTSMNQVDSKTGLTGWQALGASASSIASGILNTFITAIKKVDWEQIGKSISDFFSSIDWGQLAKDVSNLTAGLFDALAKAIDGINWEEVGQAIADFIKNIKWGKVIKSLGKLALAIGEALIEAIKGLWTNGDLLTRIGTVIVGLIGFAKLTGLASKLGTAISTALSSAGTINLASAGLSKITLGLAGVVIAWEVGNEIGNSLGKKIAEWMGDEELAKYYDEYDSWTKWLPELASALEDGSFWDGFSDMAADAGKGFLSLFGIEFDDDTKEQLKEWGKSTYNEFWGGFNQAKMGAVEAGNNGSDYKNVWFEYDENGNPRYAYNSNKLHYHWQEQKGVNYEYDENGNVKYAYQNKNKYKDSNLATHQKLKLEIEAKYNNKEISLGSFERYMDFIDRAYSYAKKHNMKIETVMGGDIQNLNDLNEWVDGFSILNSNADGYHTSNYDIDVGGDVDKPSDIDKLGGSMNYLQGQWHNKDARMSVNTSVDGQEGAGVRLIQNLGDSFKQKLFDIWKSRDATFTAETSGVGEATGQYNGLKNLWKNQSANFSITSTGGPEARQQFNDTWNLFDKWGNKSANFEIGLNVSSGTVKNIANDVIKKINDQLDNIGWFKNFKNATPIPYIAAKGGIATTATFGIWGEAGTEALVPLENNLGWLSKMSSMITDELITSNRLPDITKGQVLPANNDFLRATSGTGTSSLEELITGINSNKAPIVLELNGRQIAQVVWDESAKRYKQTGINYGY